MNGNRKAHQSQTYNADYGKQASRVRAYDRAGIKPGPQLIRIRALPVLVQDEPTNTDPIGEMETRQA